MVRWPERIEAGTVCREPLWSMDFVPMALKAAELDLLTLPTLPTDGTFDGRDPTATLAGEAPSPHQYLYWQWGSKSAAVRQGQYKLIRESKSRTRDWQLFDLSTDLGETTNLAASKPELAGRLEAEFERWRKDAKTGRQDGAMRGSAAGCPGGLFGDGGRYIAASEVRAMLNP